MISQLEEMKWPNITPHKGGWSTSGFDLLNLLSSSTERQYRGPVLSASTDCQYGAPLWSASSASTQNRMPVQSVSKVQVLSSCFPGLTRLPGSLLRFYDFRG